MQTPETSKLLQTTQSDHHDIIYTLRTIHQNQTQLNLMADQKANILIGLVIIIFTVLLTRIPQFHTFSHDVLISIYLFCAIEVIGLLFALFVIIPKNISMNHYKRIQDMSNPLFCGSFTCFEEDEYVDYLMSNMNSSETAREYLIRDMYQMGLVLRRKFVLIKYAYAFSVAGVIFPFVYYLFLQAN